MLFLITNWKWILSATVSTIATAGLAYLLHTVDVDRLEAEQRQAIIDQKTADTKSCNDDKAITEGVSHAYQDKLSALTDQLNTLQRVRPNVCIHIAAKPAAGHNAASGTTKPADTHGTVDSASLYDFAGESEKYRLQLLGCQQFINETWKEKATEQ